MNRRASDLGTKSDSDRLAVIEHVVTQLQLRLLGEDGNRGIIDELDVRLTILENLKGRLIGIGIGLGVAGGVGIRAIWDAATK